MLVRSKVSYIIKDWVDCDDDYLIDGKLVIIDPLRESGEVDLETVT